MAYKRILTIQDISCVGQCSMTVAMPVLSACGHETCILPTALLSTHTGGFGKPTVVHFDDTLDSLWKHWKENDITFDAILVGYLGSIKAIETAKRILDEMLARGGVAIVDPVMGDHGKLYSGFDDDYAAAMKGLCDKADILIPNITEAAILSGKPYREALSEEYVTDLLNTLGHKKVVLTGVGYHPGETGFVIRDGGEDRRYSHAKIGKNYHGTGDLFAACFTGALLQEKSVFDAAVIGAEFVCKAIENTQKNPAHWYGLKFETVLGELSRLLCEKQS